MSRQLIIKGCLRRARFALDLDLDVDLTEPLGIFGARRILRRGLARRRSP